MILLDTHAMLWLASGDRRGRRLGRLRATLCISPVSLLEAQMLIEMGRVASMAGQAIVRFEEDDRWRLDAPPSDEWFAEARAVSWTRDPFDRLLVAHASLRRCRLATADRILLDRLPGERVLEL